MRSWLALAKHAFQFTKHIPTLYLTESFQEPSEIDMVIPPEQESWKGCPPQTEPPKEQPSWSCDSHDMLLAVCHAGHLGIEYFIILQRDGPSSHIDLSSASRRPFGKRAFSKNGREISGDGFNSPSRSWKRWVGANAAVFPLRTVQCLRIRSFPRTCSPGTWRTKASTSEHARRCHARLRTSWRTDCWSRSL